MRMESSIVTHEQVVVSEPQPPLLQIVRTGKIDVADGENILGTRSEAVMCPNVNGFLLQPLAAEIGMRVAPGEIGGWVVQEHASDTRGAIADEADVIETARMRFDNATIRGPLVLVLN